MLVTVDPSRNEPLFAQLAASVRSGLVSGTIGPGERLPAARDLAASLQINVHTVLRAYAQLRDEGLIELRRGRGATVADTAPDRAALITALDDLVVAARHLGIGADAAAELVRQRFDNPEKEGS